MFNGFDFDSTMLRIGSMNMLLHGVESANLRYRDSLAEEHGGDADAYSLILANPPFAGSLDYETTAKDLLKIVKTKKTELLFMALFLRLLKPGGRAAVIVPDGVLFGSSTAHKAIRRMLVEDHKLDGDRQAALRRVPALCRRLDGHRLSSPRPTPAAPTTSGSTTAGRRLRLDDKRTPLLPAEKLGPVPAEALSEAEHAKNNLPDMLARWAERDGAERERPAPRRALRAARPRSRAPATTSRSTATRRWCTRRWSTARRRRSSRS